MNRPLTIGSLFSGIGGFDLAFRNAGAEASWFCEKDEVCQSVLRRHWHGVPIYGDIATASDLPSVDILCGGWPCQDLSVAGKRAGLSGERSGLFFEFIRVINELQPLYVVWENVPGLRTSCSCRSCGRRCADCNELAGADELACLVCGSEKFRGRVLRAHRGADLFTVVSTFGFIGFDGAWTLLDSQYFGVAQRRQRMFGVFAQRGIGAARCTEILSFANRSKGNPPPSREAGEDVAGNAIAGTVSCKWAKGTGGPSGNECQNLTVTPTLRSNGDAHSGFTTGDGLVTAFTTEQTPKFNKDQALTLTKQSPTGGGQVQSVFGQFGVRRLTPTECERLQGFPDGHTAFGHDGKPISDSARCRMLGNAVCVPTAEWIARRITQQEAA